MANSLDFGGESAWNWAQTLTHKIGEIRMAIYVGRLQNNLPSIFISTDEIFKMIPKGKQAAEFKPLKDKLDLVNRLQYPRQGETPEARSERVRLALDIVREVDYAMMNLLDENHVTWPAPKGLRGLSGAEREMGI